MIGREHTLGFQTHFSEAQMLKQAQNAIHRRCSGAHWQLFTGFTASATFFRYQAIDLIELTWINAGWQNAEC